MIAGASCRAAAASAAAAGWLVHAADCFDDLDLGAVAAATHRVRGYPAGVVAAVGAFPAVPWCYTGALENHPDLVARISAARPLAGCPPEAVRLVRDPMTLATLAADAGLTYPDTHASPAGLPADGTYLRKPRASAGGRGIAPWTDRAAPTAGSAWIWQRHVPGDSLSAVLSLAGERPRLLGTSRQLVGEAWCRAPAFAFCGAVGTSRDELPAAEVDGLERFAAVLHAAGLRGLVGVDLVRRAEGLPAVIEVNPRPTASAELIERATGESFIAIHLAAFGLRSPRPRPWPVTTAVWSKAILFTSDPLAIDRSLVGRLLDRAAGWTSADGWPAIADVPRPGQTLRAGGPVLTVFARGDSAPASLCQLRDRIDGVRDVTG